MRWTFVVILLAIVSLALWIAVPGWTEVEETKISPSAIVIPSIGAYSNLVALGLNPDGSLEVPPLENPRQAGWYAFGTDPGDRGPAVIVGHVDGHGHEGVFAHLSRVRPGDNIVVLRHAADPVEFLVDRVVQVPKNTFPTHEVYGTTKDPELRLITCTGHALFGVGYDSNLIVYAKMRK